MAQAHWMSRVVGECRIKPHLVVSVHPLLQHIPIAVLKSRVKAKLQDPVPFATVVTDLTKCHPTWYHRVRCAPLLPQIDSRGLTAPTPRV